VTLGVGETERRRGGEAEKRRGGEAERRRGGEAERRRGGEAERRGDVRQKVPVHRLDIPEGFVLPVCLVVAGVNLSEVKVRGCCCAEKGWWVG
jgi:hypothetical protein